MLGQGKGRLGELLDPNSFVPRPGMENGYGQLGTWVKSQFPFCVHSVRDVKWKLTIGKGLKTQFAFYISRVRGDGRLGDMLNQTPMMPVQ